MSGQEDPLSWLAFMLPSAGWHLPNFMSPSQLNNKKRIWAAMHPALGGREKEGVGGGGREVGREGLVSFPASTSSETIPNTTPGGSCARAPADPAAPTSESESEKESLLGTNLHNNEESREGGGGVLGCLRLGSRVNSAAASAVRCLWDASVTGKRTWTCSTCLAHIRAFCEITCASFAIDIGSTTRKIGSERGVPIPIKKKKAEDWQ